jgi:hypothetical protein
MSRIIATTNSVPTVPSRATLGERAQIGQLRMQRQGVLVPAQSLLPPEPVTDIKPSKQRKQHGPVVRSREQLVDSNGRPGAPWRAVPLLEQMSSRSAINPQMRTAGEKFGTLFRQAGLEALKASALDRIADISTPMSYGNFGNEKARRQVSEAIRALGGQSAPGASCVWHVLGLEWSLRRWGETHWNCAHNTASGVLIGALGVLASHFQLDSVDSKS